LKLQRRGRRRPGKYDFTLWDDYISIISPSGTVRTSLNNSYHGQMSGDGMFIVGTQTGQYWDETV
jgi:hypothetical protein